MEQHTHEHTKAVLNRMSRAIGHMNAVKKMIEDGRDCSDVLIQLSAILGGNRYTALSVTNHCASQHLQGYLPEKILIRSRSFTTGLMMN